MKSVWFEFFFWKWKILQLTLVTLLSWRKIRSHLVVTPRHWSALRQNWDSQKYGGQGNKKYMYKKYINGSIDKWIRPWMSDSLPDSLPSFSQWGIQKCGNTEINTLGELNMSEIIKDKNRQLFHLYFILFFTDLCNIVHIYHNLAGFSKSISGSGIDLSVLFDHIHY